MIMTRESEILRVPSHPTYGLDVGGSSGQARNPNENMLKAHHRKE